MKSIKKILIIISIIFSTAAFAQVENRDVPYTKDLFRFIEAYFNHEMDTRDKAITLYNRALASCPEVYDEYEKETHISRCDYYFGMYVIETYDLTQLEHALDDTSKEFVDPVERNKIIKAEASEYFDSSINHALQAMSLRKEKASDAMVIYTQAVSAMCSVSKISYVLSNGLKISQYASKALKVDPKNATAWFSKSAQSVYAPGIFGNANAGRKAMLQYLSDDTLIKETFDVFNLTCAVAYTYYRQNKFSEAIVWYRKCQEIYPDNYAMKDLVAKCESKIKK